MCCDGTDHDQHPSNRGRRRKARYRNCHFLLIEHWQKASGAGGERCARGREGRSHRVTSQPRRNVVKVRSSVRHRNGRRLPSRHNDDAKLLTSKLQKGSFCAETLCTLLYRVQRNTTEPSRQSIGLPARCWLVIAGIAVMTKMMDMKGYDAAH